MAGNFGLFGFVGGSHETLTLSELELGVRREPSDLPLRMYLCRVLASLGRFEDAIAYCKEGLDIQQGGSPVSTSRRLRIVVMLVRLQRAMRKEQTWPSSFEGC